MKAAFRNRETIELREVEPQKPKANEITLRIEVCGICGTDIHENEVEMHRFGHEIAGEITALGEGVNYLEVGQKIVLDSATPCGRCFNCKNGRQELCTDIQSFYYMDQFGFAQEMNAPAISAIPYEGLTPEVASLQEPLGVALDLCRLSDFSPSSNVLIIGQGPIGLMATKIAKMHGVNSLYVTDFASKSVRKEAALSYGIDGFIDAESKNLISYCSDKNINTILVTAPPPAIGDAIKLAEKGAIISFIGIGHGKAAQLCFDANEFHFKKLQLRASFASPALYGPLALSLLKEGKIDGNSLISHRFPLSDIVKAMDVATHDPKALKVVIKN